MVEAGYLSDLTNPGAGLAGDAAHRASLDHVPIGSNRVPPSSCPGLSRASTSSFLDAGEDVDGRDRPGHDDERWFNGMGYALGLVFSAKKSPSAFAAAETIA
jgi:hypothetical protein